jgi:hypothetical protein
MVAARSIERRIFIVGVPRSGTTLLQSLLAAQSQTTSYTESHFFHIHFARLPVPPWAIATLDPAPRVREFLAENAEPSVPAADWFTAGDRRWMKTQPMLALDTRRVARQLLGVLDQLTERRGATAWIEKTPRHLRSIPLLERLGDQPPMHFVHVIRDGLDVVASLREASQSWQRPYDLETCIRRWNADVRFSLNRIGSPRDHFVFYEELTEKPEATLERLLAELGLGWEPGILERYGRASEELVTGEEAWKAGVGRSIRRSGTSDRRLTAEQRDRASRSLRHDLYRRLFEAVR